MPIVTPPYDIGPVDRHQAMEEDGSFSHSLSSTTLHVSRAAPSQPPSSVLGGWRSLPKAQRQRLLMALKLLVVGGIFLLLYLKGSFDGLLPLMATANVGLLILGGAATVIQTAISAWKWLILVRHPGQTPSFFGLLRVYLAANFVNLFTPSFIGGDAYRTAQLRKLPGGIGRAFSSVIVDRLTGLMALLFLAGIGAISLFVHHHQPLFLGLYLMASLAAAAACPYVLAGIWSAWPERLLPKVRGVAELIVLSMRPGPALVGCLMLSLLFQLNVVVINWIYGAALGTSATFGQLMLIVPLVYLLEMIPVSINGIGLREGGFAFLFAAAGLPAEQGLALGLTISVMRYVVASVCGLPCMMWVQGISRRAEPESGQECTA